MGQTLTHGVYLPDEGERNCYSGLAANWQILDTSVGTIAEHTTALAGKAPAVHTHTVSQITDFPAYGNAAGTICEGNDSRLSDARTPVAHTHTKADVTDLLNSNFIPSANNSYDLGSSSYQWNNLYAKNYYYNGTAWGLDKNNKWLTTNIFTGSVPIFLRGSDNDIYNVSPQSLVQSLISFVDKNNTTMSSITFQHRTDTPETHRLCFRQKKVTSDGYYGVNLNNLGDFYPDLNNTTNLGTSTNKWKSLNGINPGALSLPSASYIDISSSITDRNYGANYYTAPSNGYVCIGSMASSLRISNDTLGFGISGGTAQDGYSSVYIPVRTGDTVRILLNQTSTDYQTFRFYPCQGNV